MFDIKNYIDIVIALIIIGIFLFISYLVFFIFEKIFTKIVKRTKTTLDDEILKRVKTPTILIIFFIGLYLGLLRIELLVNYQYVINKIFTLIYILLGTFFVTRILDVVIREYNCEFSLNTNINVDKAFMSMLKKIIYGFIYAIALMLILREAFNVEITPLLASLGIAGLAVALALQDSLSNFFAGIYIIADKPIKFDNFIELENGMKGYVKDVGWRTTKIKTLENNIIIIPNSKLAQNIIINYYALEQEMSVVVPCGVSYNSDLERVEKITIEVAKEIQQNIPGAVKNFEPFIRYNKFDNSNINFSIILRVEKFVDQYFVVHEFIKKLMTRYNKERIEISFPIRNIYFKNVKQ
ncbi:MAG: mechanosensitive ion channel family protein [Candidatus Altarchaeum sp.]|nr:mechanosensitive ion channel family protein [Candidatus Altarchaeum sp.]